ncbi:glycoside hydrolase family 16 protein [Niallia sp. XMNu-256]|uniref:glycoside hydrolase family 16 protein n=1 Tax=Niallia sp. XMNu-256 TaxID=3082444 RepID=UPI0030CAFFDB
MRHNLLLFFFCLPSLVLSGCQFSQEKRDLDESHDLKEWTKQETKVETSSILTKEIKTLESGQWNKVWEDTFENLEQTDKKWNFIDKGNNYNNELQYYKKENMKVMDGTLHIIGEKELYKGHPYTSGQINTLNKKHIEYGRIEIRAKHPAGKGLFPAIWLLPVDQTKGLPEIDIFEAIGNEPSQVYMVHHTGTIGNLNTTHDSFILNNINEFHDYALEWEENELRWYIDNQLRFVSRSGVPNEPMYLIINLAIGGDWPGDPNHLTAFPSSFDIDFVKVYEKVNEDE